ncbi:DUF3850 domain-containing protein [Clostridium tertium]
MKMHELKILPQYFNDVKSEKKSFELRKNDRDFEIEDILILKEFNPHEKYETMKDDVYSNFSGKKALRQIIYILTDIEGLNKDYAILGVEPIDSDIELEWKSDMNEWGTIYCPFLNKEVMTYYPVGAPAYDSITNPFINEDGEVYYYKYDHDEGGWCEDMFHMCDVEEYINLKEVLWY